MLLILMYHKAGTGKRSNSPAMLDEHFAALKDYPITLPGKPLSPKLNICLTFDDATADFADTVYPLLQKHSLPAVLAVPTGLIDTPGYCSWSALKSMDVTFASHTHTHANLKTSQNLTYELTHSKQLLEDNLNTSINTLIYPFGTFSSTSNKAALEHYTYLMRIGGAYNFSWKDPLLYRVSADNLTSPLSALKQPLKLFTKTLLKKARCH
ncbi:MAG: hypothetical protein SP1CHLAM54_06890 [Chlamydiia bacterium]|nr:hypothetical protein [Chlamydiia bacterium]MCH9615595.1 hypothetical protein [Chlamydiia bacterium]MCH9629002.1 hypothetical protein [Chlamydiia bacterium]